MFKSVKKAWSCEEELIIIIKRWGVVFHVCMYEVLLTALIFITPLSDIPVYEPIPDYGELALNWIAIPSLVACGYSIWFVILVLRNTKDLELKEKFSSLAVTLFLFIVTIGSSFYAFWKLVPKYKDLQPMIGY